MTTGLNLFASLLLLLLHKTIALAADGIVTLHSPHPEQLHRLPWSESSSQVAVELDFELHASQQIQSYFAVSLCLQIVKLDEHDNVIQDGSQYKSCEFTRPRTQASITVSATGRYIVSVWAIDSNQNQIADSVSSTVVVVEQTEFVPNYEWQIVEDWQTVPPGLDIRMPLNKLEPRVARIPDPFEFRTLVKPLNDASNFASRNLNELKRLGLSVDHSSHRVGFTSIMVNSQSTVADVQAQFASVLGTQLGCVTISIAGYTTAQLENLTVGQLKLFTKISERHVQVYQDFTSTQCECFQSMPCSVYLDSLLQCAHNAVSQGHSIEKPFPAPCIPLQHAYSQCATRCSAVAITHVEQPKFQHLDPKPELMPTTLECNGNKSSPSNYQYCSCTNCALSIPNSDADETNFQSILQLPDFHLMNPPKLPPPHPSRVLLGSSRHASIFDQSSNTRGQSYGVWKSANSRIVCDHMATEPVWIISVWSLVNIFHLSHDLLLPLFQHVGASLGTNYHVYLDIGHVEERSKLPQIRSASWMNTSAVSLLRHFIRPSHLHSTQELFRFAGSTVCWKNIRFGLNLENTPTQYGLAHPPPYSILPDLTPEVAVAHVAPIYQLGKQFNEFVRNSVCVGADDSSKTMHTNKTSVLFINRRSNRKFSNLAELKGVARAVFGRQSVVKDVALERMSFCDQVNALRKTNVLVCVCGQGCTNTMFLDPMRSVLVLIVPRGISGWRWLYQNAAKALGIPVLVYEWDGRPPVLLGDINDDRHFEGWTGEDDEWFKSDIEGNHPNRDPDEIGIVDPMQFTQLLQKSAVLLGNGPPNLS